MNSKLIKKFLIITVLGSIATPIVLHGIVKLVTGSWADYNSTLEYYGAMLGSCLGGIITMFGLYMTIKEAENQRLEDKKRYIVETKINELKDYAKVVIYSNSKIVQMISEFGYKEEISSEEKMQIFKIISEIRDELELQITFVSSNELEKQNEIIKKKIEEEIKKFNGNPPDFKAIASISNLLKQQRKSIILANKEILEDRFTN